MSRDEYDIITVGGGLGGLALGKAMAERGRRVLVLEKSTEFKDRVRGEVLVPWGCREADRLGMFATLDEACGHHLRYWISDIGGLNVIERDLVETLSDGYPVLTFYHPDMQRAVEKSAIASGAEVVRGASVKAVHPGERPQVDFTIGGEARRASARLVAGADGRNSAVRKWCKFPVERAEERRYFAGILFEGVHARDDAMHSRFAPDLGLMSWVFPQGGGRARCYVGYHARSTYERLQGDKDIPRFIETAVSLGAPPETFEKARPAGPLATFDATDNWVEHAHRDGVVLLGDAASTSDPTWGQGMSQTFFDVRVLADALSHDDDWHVAADAYAAERERAARAIRTADGWYTDILLDIGPEAEAARARALPLIAEDLSRIPDTPLAGPEIGADDTMRRRFFGLDAA